jgi:hypothetical protein
VVVLVFGFCVLGLFWFVFVVQVDANGYYLSFWCPAGKGVRGKFERDVNLTLCTFYVISAQFLLFLRKIVAQGVIDWFLPPTS